MANHPDALPSPAHDAAEILTPALRAEYLEELSRQHDNLMRAIGDDDHLRVERIAHVLKGNGAVYGFPQVSELAAQLEGAAQAHRIIEVGRLLEALANFIRHHPSTNP